MCEARMMDDWCLDTIWQPEVQVPVAETSIQLLAEVILTKKLHPL